MRNWIAEQVPSAFQVIYCWRLAFNHIVLLLGIHVDSRLVGTRCKVRLPRASELRDEGFKKDDEVDRKIKVYIRETKRDSIQYQLQSECTLEPPESVLGSPVANFTSLLETTMGNFGCISPPKNLRSTVLTVVQSWGIKSLPST